MQNTLPKRLVSRWAIVVIGVVMTSLGSAAPAHTRGEVGRNDLSAEDRCAIVKLRATWLDAKCMADARISGITQGLTNEEVDARLAACKDRTDEIFESAEGDAVSSTCTTIGDADVVNYALSLATHIATACRTSEQPCDFRAEDDPAALSATTLRNRTPHAVTGSVGFMRAGIFCRKDFADYVVSGPIPGRIEAGQTGRADAAACLIQHVQVFMQVGGAQLRCTEYGSPSGTWYRTFQVVLRGDGTCLVNRP